MSAKTDFISTSDGPASSEDKAATETASQAHDIVQKVILGALHASAKTHQQALVITSLATVGVLHLFAKLLQSKEDGDNDTPVNSTQTLVAALAAYHMSPGETKAGFADSEFSPRIFVEAFNDFEKLMGRKPDDDLVPGFADMTRKANDAPAVTAMMEKARRGGATLN